MKANNHIDPIKAGFSDMRLWPCYGVLALGTLLLTPFVGFFSAAVFVGLPLFLLSVHIVGITRKDSVLPKQWQIPVEEDVYASIDQREERLEKENHLLRRNMKIIQEDEQEIKKLTKTARAHGHGSKAAKAHK